MPDWKDEIRKRLSDLELSPLRELEIVEELSQHLEDRYQELLIGGVSEEEAYRVLLDELSGKEVLAEELRRVEQPVRRESVVLGAERRNLMSDLWQDLRYGFRILSKNAGFTLVALLSLALGIGANTAIFQLIDSVRLRTLPVKNPEEVVEVRIRDMNGARGNFNSWHATFTNPIWEQMKDRQQAFSGIFAWGVDGFNLSVGGEARIAQGLWVSGDFFNVLGVKPILGRLFNVADDMRGCGSPGVVISYSFWQREFGGDVGVIGRKLTLESKPVEIIGVTPSSFFGLEIGRSFDVAVPICSEAFFNGQENRIDSGVNWWLTVMGRLKPGSTVEQATAYLNEISPGVFEASLPSNYPSENVKDYLGFKLAAYPAGTGVSLLRETYEDPLWLLMLISALVLLIACANLANLMLARASSREREIAVRLALGASRGRLLRQLMTESLLLAIAGALLGILLAQALSEFLVSFISTKGDPFFVDLNPGWHVLGFTAVLAILTCLLFGLTPALRATRIEPGVVMKAGGRGLTAGRERFSLRRILVVSQVAISLVLLVCAFLFSRSLGNLLTLNPGFQQENILITNLDFSHLNLPKERVKPFRQELIERLKAVPGVDSVAETYIIPLGGSSWSNKTWIDGNSSKLIKDTLISRIGPDYFKTLRTELRAGRDFNEHDTATSTKVAIVNEAFAQQLANGENPVGKRFWVEQTPRDPETLYEIVGLVENTKYRDLREDFTPIAFFPMSQEPRPGQYDRILIRSNIPMAGLISSVKLALAEVSPDITLGFRVFKTDIRESLLRERLMATLSGFFGLLALLLACIGLYGIMSYGVTGRINEIGIRMALGAQQRDVLWLILREALILVLIGVVIGLPVVLAATRLVSSLLFGLAPADAFSLSLAVLLMFAVAAVAGYIPARRATKVDPMVALRYE
jgi:putative ABC transport system permease protein